MLKFITDWWKLQWFRQSQRQRENLVIEECSWDGRRDRAKEKSEGCGSHLD